MYVAAQAMRSRQPIVWEDRAVNAGDLLGSAIVAAIISGVVIFTYQQWLQARIARIEGDLEQQRNYQQKSHETLVAAYKKIWAGLVEIEHWLTHKMWKEIEASTTVDPEQWTFISEMYKDFRSEMLFLPDALYERTRELIRDLETNMNGLLGALREAIAAKEIDPEGYATDPRLITLVNDALDRLRGEYRSGLDDLRRDYQAISRDLLLGDVERDVSKNR
jgi:hypothetical protein